MKSRVYFGFLVILITMVGAFTPTYAETPKTLGNSMGVIDALKEGIISLNVQGSETTVKISVNGDKDLAINFPIGITKLGFVTNNKVHPYGWWGKNSYTKEGLTLKLGLSLGTDDLDGKGFYIDLEKPLSVKVQKGQGSIEGKGKLKIDVPSGFTGFTLDGFSGTVIGEISVERNRSTEEDAPKFVINYSGMKVKQK